MDPLQGPRVLLPQRLRHAVLHSVRCVVCCDVLSLIRRSPSLFFAAFVVLVLCVCFPRIKGSAVAAWFSKRSLGLYCLHWFLKGECVCFDVSRR